MASSDSDGGGGGGGHRPRSSERDRGARHRRRHRSPSPSPPRHRRKRSRSPSVEEHRDAKPAKSAAGGEKHGRRGDRQIRRDEELTPQDPDRIPEKNSLRGDQDVSRSKAREVGEEGDGEEGRVRVKKSYKEDRKSEREADTSSHDSSKDSEGEDDSKNNRERRKRIKEKSRKHRTEKKSKSKHRAVHSESEADEESETEGSSAESSEDSEDEHKRAKRRKRRKQMERDEREHRKRRKEKKRKLKEKEREQEKKRKKKEKVEKRAKGPITESWGKYGIIKEIDMWTRRPEFSAWLAEVKKVNLETLTNREEKDMYKQYMEDYNTATFPSKKYYNIDIYHRRKMTKMRLKDMKEMAKKTERTVFDDEEQRRQELIVERSKQKESELDKIKRTMMQTGMGQAMREQAVLREEMQYHYRLGNVEAAAAIQRRLEPDVPGALH